MFYGPLFIGVVMGTMIGIVIMSLMAINTIRDLRAENYRLMARELIHKGDTYWGPGQ
jgi:uncharacterized integral membrane protein